MAISDRSAYTHVAERRPFGRSVRGAPRRRSRRVRWAVTIVLLALFAAALAYLVHDEMQADNQLAVTRSSLNAVQAQMGPVSQQLALARRDLSLVSTQVGSASTALAQAESQLKAAQSALDAARSHVSQETAQIGSLHTCLGGVERALNALAVKSKARAIQALSSVSGSCQEAAANG